MFCVQANPSDPDNFPFVVLGNKVDIDSGNSRVVCAPTYIDYQTSKLSTLIISFKSFQLGNTVGF